MNLVELIDKFVAFIDPGSGVFRRLESAPWIDALETKLPRRLPASFRSLVTRCYIQFARPEGGSYVPICFDARRSVSNREFPICGSITRIFFVGSESVQLRPSPILSIDL